MIEGLKLDIDSNELKDWLQARADAHKAKAEFYAEQAKHFEAEEDAAAKSLSNSPVSSMEQSARTHRDKFGMFSFMADHIIPNEVYRLTEADLLKLEIVSRYF